MNALTELQTIPGVGVSLSQNLFDLGYVCVDDLKDQDPEEMYLDLMVLRGEQIDRCVLYVLRCAVYYASNAEHEPELLKWWNWKDQVAYPLGSNPELRGSTTEFRGAEHAQAR